MLDGILLEQRGLPSLSIVTDRFIPTGQAIARLWGVPQYEFIAMPHPLAHLDADQLDQQASRLVPQVKKMLTSA